MDMINSSISALNALAGKISPSMTSPPTSNILKVNGDQVMADLKQHLKEPPQPQTDLVHNGVSSCETSLAIAEETCNLDEEEAEEQENPGSNVDANGKEVSNPDQPDQDTIKMFVGQVPRTMDENDLRGMFEEFGPVYQINVLRDKITGQSKGCCFVTFFTRKAALEAQNALHNIKTLAGMHHPIQMKPADTENRNERKLFVGMVSKKYSESDVRVMFSSFGTIEECTVLRDTSGVSKGCAFVTFSTRQCAINAIKAMHHSQTMEGCSSPLVVKFADTQKEKEQKKVLQLQNNLWSLSATPITTPTVAASNLISPQYLTALHQLQAINGFAAGGVAGTPTSLSMVNSATAPVAQQPAQPTQQQPAAQSHQQQASLNPYQGAGLSAATTATAQPVNFLALQQFLAANGATVQQGHHPMGMTNGVHQQALAATSSMQPTNAAAALAAAGLYTFSNGTSNGNSSTTTPTNVYGGGLMTNMDLSNLGLAIPAHQNYLAAASQLGLTGLGSLATMAPGLQAYHAGIPMLTGAPVATSMASTIQAHNQAAMAVAAAAAAAAAASSANPASAGLPGLKQHEGPEGANLFIYHLPQEFTDSDLLQTFNPFGNVISAKVFIDKQTNLSKCFGFVSYDSPLSAQAAIQAMNGFQVGTKRLKVQLKRSKDASKPY